MRGSVSVRGSASFRRTPFMWAQCFYETSPFNSLALPPLTIVSDKSFLMSNHLRFGLPLLLFPGTSTTITLLPTYSSSLLNTCSYHLPTFLHFLANHRYRKHNRVILRQMSRFSEIPTHFVLRACSIFLVCCPIIHMNKSKIWASYSK